MRTTKVTKADFRENKNVGENLRNIYSCMKVIHGKDIDSESLITVMWRNFPYFCLDRQHSMPEIAAFCQTLNAQFGLYFKYSAR